MKLELKREYLQCGIGGGKTKIRKWKNISESEWLEFYRRGVTEPFIVSDTDTHKEEENLPEAKEKGSKKDKKPFYGENLDD